MKYFLPFLLYSFTCSIACSQSLTIGNKSKLVMKGNVFLVVKNAALINNGTLADSSATLHFTGHRDTSFSYVSGTQATSIHNLTVHKSAYGTALKSPVAVRNVLGVYGGILYPDSNLTLRSDSNLTARVDVVPAGANIIGKSIVERYFPPRRAWRLVTSPLTATTSIFDSWQNKGVYEPGVNTWVTGPNPSGAAGNGLDASPQNNASMKTWNAATQALVSVLNTKALLSPGNTGNSDNAGYFLFVRGDRNPDNFYLPNSNHTTLRSNGALQVGTQHFTAAGNGGAYTLIGNPFASPVDFNSLVRTNLVKRFYVWDPSLNEVGAYVMLDDLDNDGIFTKSLNASQQNNHLQSGQAFFVETITTAPAGISIAESSKSAGNNNALFRPGGVSTDAGADGSIRIVLNLKEADGTTIVADGVLLQSSAAYSSTVDRDDARKFGNVNETLSLLRNNFSLVAERRPPLTENDTLFLKLTKTVQRNYQFQFEPAHINDPLLTAWLEDSYLKTMVPVDLHQTSSVDFTVDGNTASSVNDRFRIVFKRAAVLPVSIISVNAFAENEHIIVNWTVANEINISAYQVERSADGVHFSTIAEKMAAGSNTVQYQYSITDHQPISGYNFYRIRYVDETGVVHYSSTVKIKMETLLQSSVNIYPNPIENNTIHLLLKNSAAGKYHVKLLTEAGQLVQQLHLQHPGGTYSFQLVPPVRMPAASYFLEITGEAGKAVVKKIWVSK